MNTNTPRLRMFAGPNGSGKSTFKTMIRRELLGIYINPDEIEKEIAERGFLDLNTFSAPTTEKEILDYFNNSPLLKKAECLDEAQELRFNDNKLSFHDVLPNAYFASVAADFIRQKLIQSSRSFTFETVMSFPDKVDILQKAQARGYRTYLYYVATENPDINVSRVQYRVSIGGHPVPEDKIVTRYHRSLDLLMQAVQSTHRA
ncbi:MAG: zeta toxin family protein, partial [Verrucomicrobia bacterium]|nr:zeta toxin family protein [Verrucomicrobiota bacterium]